MNGLHYGYKVVIVTRVEMQEGTEIMISFHNKDILFDGNGGVSCSAAGVNSYA